VEGGQATNIKGIIEESEKAGECRLSPEPRFLKTEAMVFVFIVLFFLISIFFISTNESGGMLSANVSYTNENSQTVSLLSNLPYVNKYSLAIGGGGNNISEDGLAIRANRSNNGEDNTVSSNQESIYVVREGDSLSQIAEMFGVSVNTIIWANDLGQYIHSGQHLVILPFSGVRHQIGNDDTLSKIAKEYDAEVEDVIAHNNMSVGDTLIVGNFIDVPGGVKSAPAEQRASSPSAPQERATSSGGYAQASGYFIRPIQGGIRTQGLHGRNAVDLAAPYGTPIYAAAGGVVSKSRTGWNGGYGNYIEIEHDNGTGTLYSHNSRNIVSVGQRVHQGQVIGYVGSTGLSTGPHVHFEVHGASNPF